MKKNIAYNFVYQILILIIPLIMAPYLSRVIGVDGVGIYSYTYSIVYYFMILTLLGVNNYGNRTIAKNRDDKRQLSKTFWSIYSFQLIMGLVMIIAYIGYILLFSNIYKEYAIIEILFIISSILDINWFFFGLEEFKKTITRNIFIKLATVLLIFLFVKNANDLWKYTLIMSGMTCLSQMILWSFLIKKVDFIKINLSDIKKHIKPNLVLFIPVISVSIYKMMDKIMLGVISNVTEVGYYENAEKIHGVPMALISAIGTVMLPKISNLISKGENEQVKKYISTSIRFVMFLSFGMCLGLIGIGYNFAPVYFGGSFQKTGILIMLLALTLPFYAFANVLRTQYLIPKEKDKIYVISVTIGAITNLIMNIILIPILYSAGACIGTIAAELSVLLYQAFMVRKELEITEYIRISLPYLLTALIMFASIYSLNYLNTSKSTIILLQILLGCLIYALLNIKYVTSLTKIKHLRKKVK